MQAIENSSVYNHPQPDGVRTANQIKSNMF